MHIHFLITGLTYGGADTQLVRLAIGLKDRGWTPRVITMVPPDAHVEELECHGVAVDTLGMRPGNPDPRALLKLIRTWRKTRPTIVHSHMVHANLLARLVRPFTTIPVMISTAHNIDEGGKWREFGYRCTDRLCDLTTNVSQAAVERYVRIKAAPAQRILHMANGIDTGQFRPDLQLRSSLRSQLEVQDRFVFLAVGRLVEAKDYPNLLHAFARLTHRFPQAILLLGGDGPLRESLVNLAGQLGITSKVQFLGIRTDMPALMNAADVYVMSSAWEGLPMVLLEASACGLPLVATDVGGNREVVFHGKNGLLVPPGSKRDLAEAMASMIQRPPADLRKMGEWGRDFSCRHYSLDQVIGKWEELYGSLLVKKGIRWERSEFTSVKPMAES